MDDGMTAYWAMRCSEILHLALWEFHINSKLFPSLFPEKMRLRVDAGKNFRVLV